MKDEEHEETEEWKNICEGTILSRRMVRKKVDKADI
jgi:hypothetical protein